MHFWQEVYLSDRRKPYHSYPRIAGLEDVEALAFLPLFAGGFQELRSILGELGLESSQVILGGLVLLSSSNFSLDLGDFFQDTHGEKVLGLTHFNPLAVAGSEADTRQVSSSPEVRMRTNEIVARFRKLWMKISLTFNFFVIIEFKLKPCIGFKHFMWF